jgi:hypothetical protein
MVVTIFSLGKAHEVTLAVPLNDSGGGKKAMVSAS